MSIRARVATELGILALLVIGFLLCFPRRNPRTDFSLAIFALVALVLSSGYTKSVIWAASPPASTSKQLEQCAKLTALVTLPTVAIFVLVGAVIGYRHGGWPAVVERVFNWRLLAVFAAYFVWALIQQTLFQFYLLGRLLVLVPKKWPLLAVGLSGISISLVHWPDMYTMIATAFAGMVWSFIYFRFRYLVPLAVSHAALGCTFYACLLGQDFVSEWKQLLP